MCAKQSAFIKMAAPPNFQSGLIKISIKAARNTLVAIQSEIRAIALISGVFTHSVADLSPRQGQAIIKIYSKHLFLVSHCTMPACVLVWNIEFVIDWLLVL